MERSEAAAGWPPGDFEAAKVRYTFTYLSLKDFSGKYLVLYFYPRDMTSGCTLESQDFRDHYKSFQKLNCEILGVSRDTIKSHDKFCEKESLPFKLISDSDEKLCEAYDVMKENNERLLLMLEFVLPFLV